MQTLQKILTIEISIDKKSHNLLHFPFIQIVAQ